MTRPRIAPYLTVTPAAAAIAFYTAAFGAKQRALMPSLDGLRIAHCELLINGGSVMPPTPFELGQTRSPMPAEQVTMSVSVEYDEPERGGRGLHARFLAWRENRDAADQHFLGHALRHVARSLRTPLDLERAAREEEVDFALRSRAAPTSLLRQTRRARRACDHASFESAAGRCSKLLASFVSNAGRWLSFGGSAMISEASAKRGEIATGML